MNRLIFLILFCGILSLFSDAKDDIEICDGYFYDDYLVYPGCALVDSETAKQKAMLPCYKSSKIRGCYAHWALERMLYPGERRK